MNHQEARKVLNVTAEADEKTIDKAFKKAAAKWHPDVNKEEGAEAKFKEINEAYRTLKNPEEEAPFPGGVGFNINDILRGFHGFNGFEAFQQYESTPPEPDITLNVSISFKEAFEGCTQQVKFNRKEACLTCRGLGKILEEKACNSCGGGGRVQQQQRVGNQTFVTTRPCSECRGYGRPGRDCTDCKDGKVDKEKTNSVKIPPGIPNNATIRILHEGNYCQYRNNDTTDLYINVHVEPHSTHWLEGNILWTKCHISLLEALEGTVKEVDGITSKESIRIPPLSRNGDVVTIPNRGVAKKGNFNIRLDIDYGDAGKLIEFLKSVPKEKDIDALHD